MTDGPADPMERLAGLERENAKLRKINRVLMDRVERSMDFQGNAYSLFQTATVLEGKVRERTLALESVLRQLEVANDAAETARRFLGEAIESISEGFLLCDAGDRVILTNSKFRDVWPALEGTAGLDFPTVTTQLALSGAVIDAVDDAESWIRRRMECHRDPREPFILKMADGRWLQISERKTRDGGTVSLYTDITDIKLSEERRRERELAEKTRFFAAASHDLLQPLSAARVFASVLSERRLAPINRGLVRSTLAALDSVDEILTALLDISKLDAGVQPVALSEFTLDELFTGLAEEHALVASRKSLTLRFAPSSLAVCSDERLLRRLLRNYLSNAIRYTGAGGRILVGCRRRGDAVLLGVWDTGPGIPEDKLEEIFQEFRRLPNAGEGGERGMGLGLAIVRRIASTLNHPLVVRSRLGYGSLFGVEVPVLAGPPQAAPAPAPLSSPALSGLGGARIVVIDNDADMLAGMVALLDHWGCRTVGGTSGRSVLDRLSGDAQGPDLIIADYHLDHGAVGLDAIASIRAAFCSDTPAVVITADYSDGLQAAVQQAGCHLLNKPVRKGKLRSLLAHLLRERALPE
jgi:two-component system, sensor histidine kinase